MRWQVEVFFNAIKNVLNLKNIIAKNKNGIMIENRLDDETFASPAVSDGKIFIRGWKWLYCLKGFGWESRGLPEAKGDSGEKP